MVVVFCKKLPQRICLFIREMNKTLTVTKATLFVTNYNYRVVHVLTTFLQTIVHVC